MNTDKHRWTRIVAPRIVRERLVVCMYYRGPLADLAQTQANPRQAHQTLAFRILVASLQLSRMETGRYRAFVMMHRLDRSWPALTSVRSFRKCPGPASDASTSTNPSAE